MPRSYLKDSDKIDGDNPWSQYRRLVLQGLDSLAEDQVKLEGKIDSNDTRLWTKITTFELKCTEDLTALKVKAGLIGVISGMAGSAIMVILLRVLFKI